MSLTFTIQPKGGSIIPYSGISTTNGRQAIDFDAGAAFQDQKRFHSPGVDGQFLIRGKAVGRSINIIVRYMGADMATAEGYYQSDCTSFATTQVQIICMGQTYSGCNLLPESMHRNGRVRATGRTAGQVYFDVQMSFTQDNPADL
jgi:hypothetical protein